MCKIKYNPVAYMLSTYKLHFNSNSSYEISFTMHDEKMEYDKLSAFCHSLSALMGLNNISYTLKKSENKIDLFYKNTLVITYETNFIKKIKNETSLKFQFLVEWGILLELNNKQQLLIAL